MPSESLPISFVVLCMYCLMLSLSVTGMRQPLDSWPCSVHLVVSRTHAALCAHCHPAHPHCHSVTTNNSFYLSAGELAATWLQRTWCTCWTGWASSTALTWPSCWRPPSSSAQRWAGTTRATWLRPFRASAPLRLRERMRHIAGHSCVCMSACGALQGIAAPACVLASLGMGCCSCAANWQASCGCCSVEV